MAWLCKGLSVVQESFADSEGTARPRRYDQMSRPIPPMIMGSESHWPIDRFMASKPR